MHDREFESARKSQRLSLGALGALLLGTVVSGQPAPAPLIKQDSLTRVSDHVFVILDDNVGFVPNVGLVVGDRATLIVDTGLGERNGRIVLEASRKISDNDEFYLTATHFHPEHDLGATAFPENARMIRWRVQESEVDNVGAETITRFAGFSPVLADLLDGARFRPADVIFEGALTLDLGGVRVKVWGVGPNHTQGDTALFVEEDRVLFTGDTLMSVFPAVSADSASIAKWLANLDAYEALQPVAIVPAHGRMIDAELIRRYREYLGAVRMRVGELARAGVGVEEVVGMLAESLEAQFDDLRPAGGSAAGRITAAIRAAYREAR